MCSHCGKTLPINCFAVRRDTGERRDYCKGCRCKVYNATHKEQISEQRKIYWSDKNDVLSEKNRLYYTCHVDELNAKSHERWATNGRRYNETHKKWVKMNIDHVRIVKRQYIENNRAAYDAYHKQYRERNRELINMKYSVWLQTPSGKIASIKHHNVRKSLGFDPINEWFNGSEYHHLHIDMDGNVNNSIGIFIPSELHKSIPHNPNTWKGMDEMNNTAMKWYEMFVANEVITVCHTLVR